MQEQPPRPSRPSYRRRIARRARQPTDAATPKDRATREAVDILWRALTDAEGVLAEAVQESLRARRSPAAPAPGGDLQEAMRSVADYFGRVVDLIGEERRLLSQQVSSLGQVVERMEQQVGGLTELLNDLRQPRAATPAPRRASRGGRSQETVSRFAAGGEGVQLVIAPVPGFQNLMDLQRALSAMPAIEGASVDGYLDGEARLVLHLREAVTADSIAQALRQATSEEVSIEEAQPEALRLRLRLGGAA